MNGRMIVNWLRGSVLSVLAFAVAASAIGAETAEPRQDRQARRILDDAGVKGGLVVHIGCRDGKLTAALRAGDNYLVHGLDTDAANVDRARAYLQSLGLYGKVSVDRFDGRRLPYIDNLVNLLVAEDLGEVPVTEVMRVLAPKGVATIQRNGQWTATAKPWPEDIDEWTHYLHDAQGTMVARDKVVGLPRRLQWVGGPKWLRNHDFMSSLNGLVSSGGRIFYLIDEGLRNHIYLPARWNVVARDGFNGTTLWKRSIDSWFPHTWPFKSGPAYLPRRIVADGDRVYVTLGIGAPLSVLDAATGKTIRTYEETKATEEIVLSDGVLFLVVDPAKKPFRYRHASSNRGKEQNRANREFGWSAGRPARLLMAVSADTGKVLWNEEYRVAPLTLAVRGQRIFFFDGERVVALDRGNGQEAWGSERAGDWSVPATGYAPRLIAGDGVVVLSTKRARGGRLVGLSAQTGKILWRSEQPGSGHFSPEELYLIDGVVWTVRTGKAQTEGTHFVGIDSKTGQTRHDFVADQIGVFFMHQRCYPGRATERYIMASGTGTEFLELGTEKCELHHWLRGSCIYGLMPCNGLLYKTPDSCACYYQSKLEHFCALAPPGKKVRNEAPAKSRLEKGPAYAERGKGERGIDGPASDSWPTYRHDNTRSAATETPVSKKLSEIWQADIGGKLSAMTAANGRLHVAAIDQHTVYALAADTGEQVWSFTAGGRVDSPPTIHRGLAVFGCADGWVYCLRASDGKLAWRFHAAPGDDKLVSYEQVESVWPLHGSVLVRDGVAYCLAGRNMFVDGGMRLVRLDCATGQILSETILDDKNPQTGENLQTLMAGKSVPVANRDILSCDGKYVYMSAQKFDLDGKRVNLEVARGKERDQTGEGRHLFCPTGFLDDYWFHRSFWIYGRNAGEGHGEYAVPRNWAPTGRIMTFDKSSIYSFFAQNVGNNINPRTYYSLYATAKDGFLEGDPAAEKAERRGMAKRKAAAKKSRAGARNRIRHRWELDRPGLLANAMILAGRNLFLAGPPDVADEEKTFEFVFGGNDEINRRMQQQEEAWRGKMGALLWVVSADTGQRLAEYRLDAIPVWDGMAAAGGRLYLALKDGRVLCMGPGR